MNSNLISFINKSTKPSKTGLAPGSILYVGEKSTKTEMTVIDYSPGVFHIHTDAKLDALPAQAENMRWMQIRGLADTQLLTQIGEKYNIHPLVMEDVANPGQAAKIEAFTDYLYITLKMMLYDEATMTFSTDHISFIYIDNLIISFQESEDEYFGPMYKRFENKNARLYRFGSGYLLYALLDLIIDYYFPVFDILTDRFEDLEEQVLKTNEPEQAEKIHQLKRDVLFIKKQIFPLRRVTDDLLDEEIELGHPEITIYLRDLDDHVNIAIENVESLRELCSGLLDSYLSQVSNRMNEVMKVLTVISTIFIPLSFLAGVYGMNFVNMPELHYQWGYQILLGIMMLIIIGMMFFFKRKKWF